MDALVSLKPPPTIRMFANDCIADYVTPGVLDDIEAGVETKCAELLKLLLIDTENDHNTRDTAKRMARMYVREVCRGRFEPAPCLTDFPNARNLDEVVVVGPVLVRSTCAHHFCPIEGNAWIGVIPSDRIIGLSKFARVTDWIMARPQIQEEATVQIADAIETAINPRGLAVIVSAKHTCMTWRGVREHNSLATTSVMRGIFKESPSARAELLNLVGPMR